MFERSPLTYPLTRYISCLNPEVIANSNHVARKRLELCLEQLVEKEHVPGSVADKVKDEYVKLCFTPSSAASFSAYCGREQRLDHFWRDVISKHGKELPNLLCFVKKILVLSHGNATIERGFSVNKECLVENQTEKSIVAQRLVYDAILNTGGVKEIEISKSLIHYARNARSRYQEYMEMKRQERSEKDAERNRKSESAGIIKELETKKARLLADAQKEAAIIEEQVKELAK